MEELKYSCPTKDTNLYRICLRKIIEVNGKNSKYYYTSYWEKHNKYYVLRERDNVSHRIVCVMTFTDVRELFQFVRGLVHAIEESEAYSNVK